MYKMKINKPIGTYKVLGISKQDNEFEDVIGPRFEVTLERTVERLLNGSTRVETSKHEFIFNETETAVLTVGALVHYPESK